MRNLAFVLDENEHVFDGRLIAVGDQKDLPPQIAVLGLEREQRRHLVRMSRDMCLSQFPQVVEQRDRVRAGIEHLAIRLEDDLKCARTSVPGLGFSICLAFGISSGRQQPRERAGYFRLSWDGSRLPSVSEMIRRKNVAGLEPAIDQVRRDGQTPFTRQVKGLFHLVSEPGQVREARGCPRSFDGVNGPEYPMHQTWNRPAPPPAPGARSRAQSADPEPQL